MNTLLLLKELSENNSDINEHVTRLYELGLESECILELGMRTGVSTRAFLLSQPKKLISVDSYPIPESVKEVSLLARNLGVEFSFLEQDSRIEIQSTWDMLFIDTLHNKRQVYEELHQHASKTIKYIVFHDTETYGDIGERKVGRGTGIRHGMNAFLSEGDNAKHWEEIEHYTNNNGLTIWKRI